MAALSEGFNRIIAVLILLGIGALLLYFINIVFLVFAGMLFAVLLRTFGRALEKLLPLTPEISLLITTVLATAVLGSLVFFSYPEMTRQVNHFMDRLPAASAELRHGLERAGLGQFAKDIPGPVKYLSSRPDLLSSITGFFSTTFGFITNLAVILFLGIFLAANPKLYLEGFIRLFPPPARPKAEAVLKQSSETLRWWLLGRLIAMVFIGILTAIGLWVIGIPLALFLGVFAGLMTFIPYIGPILSIIPAILFAIPDGIQTVGFVLLLYLGIQTIESYVLTPIVQQKAVDLPPAYGVTLQLLLGVWAGGFGVVLAGPLGAISIVLVRELYLKPMEERNYQ